MGYVHHENHDGLGLLVHRLGFVATGQTVRLGPDEAPGYLRRDSAGYATARVLSLPDTAMARIADEQQRLRDGSGAPSQRFSVRLVDRETLPPASAIR
ncbi:hypothetical protein DL991_25055 [Amycolatopsis sp. WAC 01375]|nr:hypothetical protein DL991_25055 [Amycolatopsis sp. WAC 01375]